MRLLNRPLALLLVGALAAASIIVIIEVISFALHSGHSGPAVVPWPTWYHWARTTRWDAEVIRVWSAILIAIGVLLTGSELKPRRVTRHQLRPGGEPTQTRLTGHGLAPVPCARPPPGSRGSPPPTSPCAAAPRSPPPPPPAARTPPRSPGPSPRRCAAAATT